ncbi:MAG: hypothetical protein HMLKMBBP_01204 [Planctomycetes bacterium]|nr:hypothetical protein [Planctomycetota bacterium]
MREMRRALAPGMLLLLAFAAESRAAPDGPERVFFREPDRATAARIEKALSRATDDSLSGRLAARIELESWSSWAVQPLLDALAAPRAQSRCSATLVLGVLEDGRVPSALRAAAARETSHPLVGGFAALAVGRARDRDGVASLREAWNGGKCPDLVQSALPLALARIRTPEARSLLDEIVRMQELRREAVEARTLALGFFPEAAIDTTTAAPSAALGEALRSDARGVRQAAVLAYLVSTARRRDGRALLLDLLAREDAPEVVSVVCLGLSAFGEADATDALLRVVEGRGPDLLREYVCDLLSRRGDARAKDALLRIVRGQEGARLRASAVTALASIADDACGDAVLARLQDRAPLVRAAASVAATRLTSAVLREEAARRVDARLKAGEQDASCRAVLELAREVLTGQRRDAVWPELGGDNLFRSTSMGFERRLLQAVNLRSEASLDLTRVNISESEADLARMELPEGATRPESAPGEQEGVSNGIQTNREIDRFDSGLFGGDNPPDQAFGQTRTTAWQEQRDLKVELRRRPYFTAADLPAPATAETRR